MSSCSVSVLLSPPPPPSLFLIQLWQAKYNESLILIFLSWMHFPAPGNLISCFCSCQLIGVYVKKSVSYNLFLFRSLFLLSSNRPRSLCVFFFSLFLAIVYMQCSKIRPTQGWGGFSSWQQLNRLENSNTYNMSHSMLSKRLYWGSSVCWRWSEMEKAHYSPNGESPSYTAHTQDCEH